MVRKLKTYQASQSFLRSRCRSALDEGRSRSVRREQQSFSPRFCEGVRRQQSHCGRDGEARHSSAAAGRTGTRPTTRRVLSLKWRQSGSVCCMNLWGLLLSAFSTAGVAKAKAAGVHKVRAACINASSHMFPFPDNFGTF
jgi:hypothetical protein